MSAKGQTVVLAGLLIDGTGAEPVPDAAVVIEDGRIQQVGPRRQVAFDQGTATVIDASSGVVLPGLMDSHCHVFHMYRNYYDTNVVSFVARAMQNAGMWLDMGVTTIREIGTRQNLDLGLRDVINSGLVRGPRIFASGTALAATGGGPVTDAPLRFVFEITGADEARRVTRQQLRAGVDFIKLFTTAGVPSGRPEMTFEEIQAAVDEAHKAGKHVAGHAMSAEGVKNCLRARVDTIEHGSFHDDEAIAMMVTLGTFLVPTLSITRSMSTPGGPFKTPVSVADFSRTSLGPMMAGVRKARDAGVKIAAGTDPPRVDTVPMECAALVEAGLTPMEAIVAATMRGAEILNKTDDFGTLRTGRRADLIVLPDNPLKDIRALERAELVMKDGIVVKDHAARGRSAG